MVLKAYEIIYFNYNIIFNVGLVASRSWVRENGLGEVWRREGLWTAAAVERGCGGVGSGSGYIAA